MSYISDLKKICSKYGCEIFENEPLKPHVSFRIGGCCKALVSVNSVEAIIDILRFVKERSIRYYVLGKGSNILVSDDGFDGVVILMGKAFSDISISDRNTIKCSAGASLSILCNTALENNLTGLEFAYGIPGTVGGALFMNAGAYGGEIKDVVVSAEYIDENGCICTIKKDDMELSYRHSIFSGKNYIITSVTFRLSDGEHDAIKAKMDELMQKRRSKQPLEYPSAGSTFKRPETNVFAAALIEQCGLKGFCVGDAQVSTKHSGFVINKGNATFKDTMELIEKVQETVKSKTGYTLETEPEILK